MVKNQERKIVLIKAFIILLLIMLFFIIFYKMTIAKTNVLFYLKGNDTVTIEVNNEYTESGFVAKLNEKDLTKNVTVDSNIDIKKVGDYFVTYSIYLKYLNVNKVLERKVKVVDTTKPVLEVDGEKEINLYVNESYNKPSAKAKDNYDGDLTDKIKVFSNLDVSKSGNYEISYSVKDSSNNESTHKINVNVKEKPKQNENKKSIPVFNPTPSNVPIKDAYIEVSITNQKLDYYENGQLVLSSDIVTGINNGTPTGDYQVLNKARNTTLKGKDYNSFVNYWIAFIGNSYGFHDASWRSSFGSEIYKTNGSHGCVNMPLTSVSALYDMVEIGTPVHVKY